MEFQERLEKVLRLADELMAHRDELVELAIQDLGFSRRDNQREIEITVDRLKSCSATETFLSKRTPLGEVALALSYNGSAWLNTDISTIFLVGNRIRVKLSSKGLDIAHFLESLYEPIFDDWVTFDHRPGKAFLEEALRNQHVKAICVFGSEKNLLPYEGEVRNRHKRLIFEGPGSDPFIVLQDASIENALEDLGDAKYSYSGQTCTALRMCMSRKPYMKSFWRPSLSQAGRWRWETPESPGSLLRQSEVLWPSRT